MKAVLLTLLALAAIVCAPMGCGGGGPAPYVRNFVRLRSDPGDIVGKGRAYEYDQATARITVSASGGLLLVQVRGDESWTGYFQTPKSTLMPGTYSNVQRYPAHNPAQGGMDWYGEIDSLYDLTGSFTLSNISYQNGQIASVDLKFELRINGDAPPLRGEIHWSSQDGTIPPGPVNPPPSDLWQPADGETPSSGDYIYLQSDAGEPVGQGAKYIYTRSNAQIGLQLVAGYLHVSVQANDGDWWRGSFQSMTHAFPLGYYGNLLGFPHHNPARGGLDWSRSGSSGDGLTGWFVVDSIETTESGTLKSIVIRFEQRYSGVAPALHGKIQWRP